MIEEKDIASIIDLFETNNFNVNLDTGIRTTTSQFLNIIRENMDTDKRTNAVLVLRKDNICIGYISCFIEYSNMVMGHIAIKDDEQHHGYGRLVTYIAILNASSSNRTVSCVCFHENKFLTQLRVIKRDKLHYFLDKHLDCGNILKIFMSIEEYCEEEERKIQKEIENLVDF